MFFHLIFLANCFLISEISTCTYMMYVILMYKYTPLSLICQGFLMKMFEFALFTEITAQLYRPFPAAAVFFPQHPALILYKAKAACR